MIALMTRKKPNGRETRYDPIPVVRLTEWARKLRKYADEMDAAVAMASHHGIKEVAADGGTGFDDYVLKVKRFAATAAGKIRMEVMDME